MARGAATAALAVGALCATAAPAGARPARADEVAALSRRAETDPAALAALRQVDVVDGRPAAVGASLAGAEGPELTARLRALQSSFDTPSSRPALPSAERARREASDVLRGRRFHERRTRGPFRSVLRWLGDRLAPLFRPIGRLWDHVGLAFASHPLLLALVAGVVLLGSSGLAMRRAAARRLADVERGAAAHVARRRADPSRLERQADDAEQRGDFELAIRLRFQAGILRLDAAGTLHYRPAATTGELRREVRTPAFSAVADAFDEVAYGQRPAQAGDADAAREGWQRVLAEVAGR